MLTVHHLMDKSSPYYFDLSLPHCQWWLAITAPQISYQRDRLNYDFPGMCAIPQDPQGWLQSIGESWGFSDRKGLHETIYSLATAQTHGHVWQHELAQRACDSAQAWAHRISETKNKVAQGEMRFLDVIYRHVGTVGIRGWDYSRGSFLVRSGYYAGWITDEEFAFLLNHLSIQVQYYFDNWQHYLQSFIFGRTYWQYRGDDDPDEENLPYLLNNGFQLGISRFFEQIEQDSDCPIPSLQWDIPLPQLAVPNSLNALLNDDNDEDQHA